MTFAQLYTAVLQDVGEDPAAPVYYTLVEAKAAVNEGARALAFLTLCVERSAPLTLTGDFTSTDALTGFIVPLRVLVGGQKIPATNLSGLAALSRAWMAAGTPARYAFVGSSLLAVAPWGGAATVEFAGTPATMTLDAEVPEVPVSHQSLLIDYAVGRLRMREGSQEFTRGADRLRVFLEGAVDLATKMRTRARELGWDTEPIEFKLKDYGTLLRKIEREARSAESDA